MSTQTIRLTSADGHPLDGDVAEPDAPARGGVVVCHPHPLYGGNRYNAVVDAVFRALPGAGFRAIRFDFRADHGGGTAEVADVVAALDELARRGAGEPLYVAGYSFGAAVALRTHDPRVAAIVAIASPLGAMPIDTPPTVPLLVLAPRHDQYCPPDAAAPIVADWPHTELETVESADHFLAGRTGVVADRVVAWLAERLPGSH